MFACLVTACLVTACLVTDGREQPRRDALGGFLGLHAGPQRAGV